MGASASASGMIEGGVLVCVCGCELDLDGSCNVWFVVLCCLRRRFRIRQWNGMLGLVCCPVGSTVSYRCGDDVMLRAVFVSASFCVIFRLEI